MEKCIEKINEMESGRKKRFKRKMIEKSKNTKSKKPKKKMGIKELNQYRDTIVSFLEDKEVIRWV